MTTVTLLPFSLAGDDFAQKHFILLCLYLAYKQSKYLSISGFAELRTTVARNLASVGSNFATILPCFSFHFYCSLAEN